MRAAVREHYLNVWGDPSREACFSRGECTIEVLKWDAERNPQEVAMYGTLGASERQDPEFPAHRMEFLAGFRPELDDIAQALAMLATSEAAVDDGHTVTFSEPLWRGTRARTFLVLRPPEEIVPPLLLADGRHVEFLQAIPIFPSELAFKKRNGAEGLLAHWEKRRVPFWDPDRSAEPGREE